MVRIILDAAQDFKYVLSAMKDKVPAIIISDAPTAGTGFGRVLSDIASRLSINLKDIFELACLGYGGINSRHLPYHYYTAEGMDGWIIPTLPEIWNDWAGDRAGIVMFVSDPARLQWFSRPEMCEELLKYPELKKFLTNPPFRKWIYAPVDAAGPNSRLTWPLAQNLLGFERILAYGKWGENAIRQTLGDEESQKRDLTHLPHGLPQDIFYPRDRTVARAFFFAITGAATLRGERELIKSDEALIGIIATNQSRKDFGMALEAAAILSRQRKLRLWLHLDALERAWSIPALLVDFGLIDRTIISLGHLSDDALAKSYSACDVTIGPGAEGFGFPLLESQFCGTPVVTGSYAGGSDIVPKEWQVDPVAYRLESVWSCQRPVYNAVDWAKKVNELIGKRCNYPGEYDWDRLWPERWEPWFRRGVLV